MQHTCIINEYSLESQSTSYPIHQHHSGTQHHKPVCNSTSTYIIIVMYKHFYQYLSISWQGWFMDILNRQTNRQTDRQQTDRQTAAYHVLQFLVEVDVVLVEVEDEHLGGHVSVFHHQLREQGRNDGHNDSSYPSLHRIRRTPFPYGIGSLTTC